LKRGIVCSARYGNLHLAIQFYNHEDDIDQVTSVRFEL
jgi:hypothetical protein